LEVLGWKTQSGKAKIIGTLISIGGAMLFAFYKGPKIILWRTNVNLLHHATNRPEGGHFILGIVLGLVSCVSNSLWLIVQVRNYEIYSLEYLPCAVC
jgi:drug/metabolite transporter (DMT)-like permease